MCGIVGVIGQNASLHIEAATQKIAHRGPDDFGFFHEKNLALGFRRLSIQDLSANGHQPMQTPDGRFTIIFNGEIYNHLDLRNRLKSGHHFRSTGDTETVLMSFVERGAAIFSELNGIFACAIFDKTTGQLTIARDHFGIKPLYFYQKDNDFLFGSEVKSFLAWPSLDRSIDHSALHSYIHYLYSPGEATPFVRVKKLKPGHFLQLQIDRPADFKIERFYELPFDGAYSKATENDLVAELDQRLSLAVERQLLSDVPLGFFLSGGLDSTSVVALAKKRFPHEKFQCFTIDANLNAGKEGFIDDLPFAKKAAAQLDVELEVIRAEPRIVEEFDRMIWHLDEPQADPAPLNVLNICRRAREMNRIVLLGGAAGDDLFSGYRRHEALFFEEKLAILPSFLRKMMASGASLFDKKSAFGRRASKFLKEIGSDAGPEKWANYFAWLPRETNLSLFKPEIQLEIASKNPASILIESLKNIPLETNALNKMLYWELKYFLCDHNLNYTDKMSMAVGVEVRVPFLDTELVDFSTKIPPALKMKGRTTKYLLRKTMEKYLPNDIIYRPKTGFGAPVREWVRGGAMNDLIENYLSPEAIERRGIFNKKAIEKLILDNKNGQIDASYTVWSLLAIESWMRQFADN